jgi:hypothetical protein
VVSAHVLFDPWRHNRVGLENDFIEDHRWKVREWTSREDM